MQYSVAAVIALAAASASAGYTNGTVVFTTEVHTAYTTVCPVATQVTFNGVTYTATASQTLTITNCPCTVVKPVTTSSVVAPSPAPVYPVNATTPVAPVVPVTPTTAVGTVAVAKPTTPAASPSPITASGAGKSFAVSGAALAGLLGVAAYIL